MMYHYWGMGWGWLITFIIIVAVVWIILRRGSSSTGTLNDNRPSPLDILKERYARGEITKEEYERIKKDLQD